jgi:hypothetical protein
MIDFVTNLPYPSILKFPIMSEEKKLTSASGIPYYNNEIP